MNEAKKDLEETQKKHESAMARLTVPLNLESHFMKLIELQQERNWLEGYADEIKKNKEGKTKLPLEDAFKFMV